MKNEYFRLIPMVEKLHRTHLSVIRNYLQNMRIGDIADVEAVMLCNIGNQTLTIGELTSRGCYAGSNVSYILKKMVQKGYLIQEPSLYDHRSSHVKLSDKGLKLVEKFDEVFHVYSERLLKSCISSKDMIKDVNRIYSFWNEVLNRKMQYGFGGGE